MKTKTIACVGDSITEGWGLMNFQNESYPSLLKKAFPEIKIYNFGSSGATLQSQFDMGYQHTLAFEQSLKKEFELVLLFLGANDVWYWTSEATFRAELIDLIAQYPHSKVLLVTPLKMNCGTYEMNKLTKIAQIILDVGKKEHIPVLDLFTASSIDWLSFDGVHPTKEGQEKIAQAMIPCLKEILND